MFVKLLFTGEPCPCLPYEGWPGGSGLTTCKDNKFCTICCIILFFNCCLFLKRGGACVSTHGRRGRHLLTTYVQGSGLRLAVRM